MPRYDEVEGPEEVHPGCVIGVAGAFVGAIVGLVVGIIYTHGEPDTLGLSGGIVMLFMAGGGLIGAAAFVVGYGVWRLSRRTRRRSRSSNEA
jgi:high-affinity Fe2+/Pb2+ permease